MIASRKRNARLAREGRTTMPTYRVWADTPDSGAEPREFKTLDALLESFDQIGIEEDSYAMHLHGEPLLKGLIGPMSDSKTVVRYETPEVYVQETEKWAWQLKTKKKRRRRS